MCGESSIPCAYMQEAAGVSSPVPMETATTGSTHDLECSHSERSIDEAIERTRSSETLSPTSPTMEDGKWVDPVSESWVERDRQSHAC